MPPSRSQLSRLESETGFQAVVLDKVLRLSKLLEDINLHPRLKNALALKGGTALNLFFGEPTRLSVDLDFNFIGALDRDAMLAERPMVEATIEDIARAQGYRIRASADAHAGRKLFLGYERFDGTRDQVHVDINFLHRQSLLPVERRQIWSPDSTTECAALLVSPEELAAGKLVAYFHRMAPRDVWDVSRLLRTAAIKWESGGTRAIFVALAGALPKAHHSYERERFFRLADADIEDQLHPMLTADQRPSAAELQESAWAVAGTLAEPTEAEREFADRLQAGDLRPELLFPDDDGMAQRVREHPVLRWKAQNATAHAKRSLKR